MKYGTSTALTGSPYLHPDLSNFTSNTEGLSFMRTVWNNSCHHTLHRIRKGFKIAWLSPLIPGEQQDVPFIQTMASFQILSDSKVIIT